MAGYLYKKSNRMLNTQSTMFRRRWFVLHDHMLYWYKNSIEVTAPCHHTYSPHSRNVLSRLVYWLLHHLGFTSVTDIAI
jgi:hypothetical protein